MANYYTLTSAILRVPVEKLQQAAEIIERVSLELEEKDGYLGVRAEVEANEGGVWIRADESINLAQAAVLAQTLVEELEIDEPFVLTWANTCDQLRLDSFSGGGFLVARGFPMFWTQTAENALFDQLKAWKEKHPK